MTTDQKVETQEELVLSQPETDGGDPKPESQPAETPPAPEPAKAKTPEEKERNREGFERRKFRQWQRDVEALDMQKIGKQAATDAAREVGVDAGSEGNASNVDFVTKTVAKTRELEQIEVRKIKQRATNIGITETLKELGYDPMSSQGRGIGNYLYGQFGTDDPDVYYDADRMKKEIERLVSTVGGGQKKADPVGDAILKKAATPAPRTEKPKAPDSGEEANLKKEAERMKISPEKAKKILELKKKHNIR